ncbi:MAG: hypothetical protein C0502_06805 [Opitutus sp.]|nr:hypothetical protein [Opitutus sp.]
MNDHLDRLLAELGNEPMPSLGAGFNQGVLREISARRRQMSWWACWENPRLIAAAAAAAVFIGLIAPFIAPSTRMADREALGLDVFAATPRHLPLTSLSTR